MKLNLNKTKELVVDQDASNINSAEKKLEILLVNASIYMIICILWSKEITFKYQLMDKLSECDPLVIGSPMLMPIVNRLYDTSEDPATSHHHPFPSILLAMSLPFTHIWTQSKPAGYCSMWQRAFTRDRHLTLK